MPSNIMSSYATFSQKFTVPEDDPRTEALKRYFERGGVISAVKGRGDWPRIVYPSVLRIRSQIKEIEELKKNFEEKHKDWNQRLKQAKTYHQRNQVMKLSEPLYWKHVAKSMVDPDYRSDFESVKLPVHLVADKKWKPMVRMFVEDLEYRKNLTETVQNSIVYKNDNKVAKYADQLQNFRSGVSESKMKDLQKRISHLELEIDALKKIEQWAAGK